MSGDKKTPVGLRGRHDRDVVLHARARALENQRKQAVVEMPEPAGEEFTITCDEGAYLGGDGSAPPPLAFFAASIAFCTLTQLGRYAKVNRLQVDDIRMNVTTRFHLEGSPRDDSLEGRPVGFDVEIDVDSPEPPERIARMLASGERSCYIFQSLVQPVEIRRTWRRNGEAVDPPNGRA